MIINNQTEEADTESFSKETTFMKLHASQDKTKLTEEWHKNMTRAFPNATISKG